MNGTGTINSVAQLDGLANNVSHPITHDQGLHYAF
jgi:hypothetical protein